MGNMQFFNCVMLMDAKFVVCFADEAKYVRAIVEFKYIRTYANPIGTDGLRSSCRK